MDRFGANKRFGDGRVHDEHLQARVAD